MENNVIIIGGGAAGLSAALYLARAGLEPLVLAGSPPGGQLMLTTEVENFPGQKSILGGELIEIMRAQATSFGAKIIDENVKSVKSINSVKSVELASGTVYQSKAVIIATGAKALWLGLESETRLRGKGVSACATCDGFFFKNKIVAVLGGGDSALEEALTLTKFASKVYLIHRRLEFKASKIMQKRAQENPKIEIILDAQVQEILGKFKVEGIKLLNDKYKEIKLDGVFVAIGHRPDTDLFKGLVELDEKGYVLTTATYALQQLNSNSSKNQKFNIKWSTQTSVEGIFGAGDCVDHIYKQASTAAGMGVQASLDAERWIESQIG
jgi:thioredoxin reductase (NADPH)